ncbi:MAG: response regulator [Propionibacteriaceae bacterium]|jgi:DNA-binding response OmpR family regulator|nr:response regulator [Propionibacteriaceae bacterium]
MSLLVAIYSGDRSVRDAVKSAIGTRVAPDLPDLDIREFATRDALRAALDARPFDLAILDAETTPAGGMGVCHELKDELDAPPDVVLLVARPQDSWLAAWSNAEAVSMLPVDPLTLGSTVAQVLRARLAGHETQLGTDEPVVVGGSSRH